ncbi:MAG: type II toxin-antitoxin system HicB family antitoxin [Dehalococcoidia bacterium]|nr:type II toxin-antitoxin system HicB family antitoxin [Dehalococcoidia bacterium]
MKAYVFKVLVEEGKFEDGRTAYHSYCPVLNGYHTWGYTYQEALTNIQEAVSLYVDDLIASGKAVPIQDS